MIIREPAPPVQTGLAASIDRMWRPRHHWGEEGYTNGESESMSATTKLAPEDLVADLRQMAFDLTYLAQERIELYETLKAVARERRVGGREVPEVVIGELHECVEIILSGIEELDERVEALARSLGILDRVE